jgi:DNA-binding winged helix-turn-helix (wHTH) protein
MTKPPDDCVRDYSREDFRVGGRLVRPRLNRIEYGGETVQVQPKVMGLLVCLAGHAGEVVTKAELVEEVWAGAHVTEHALARAVCELRKLFGDSAQRPRVVETIPKVGYRLIAPVSAARFGGEEARAARIFEGAARRDADAALRADDAAHADYAPRAASSVEAETARAAPAGAPLSVRLPGRRRGPAPAAARAWQPSRAFLAGALAFAALLFVLTLVLLPAVGGHRARHFIIHGVRH